MKMRARKGSLVVESLVAMMVFSTAISIMFVSVLYMIRSLEHVHQQQMDVEKFEYVMFYMSAQLEMANDFKIFQGDNWSVLIVDTSPVLAFEIFLSKDGKSLMRRLVGEGFLTFEKISKLKVGLSFFGGRNFSGFNLICKGKGLMRFKRYGDHLVFFWKGRWIYLM